MTTRTIKTLLSPLHEFFEKQQVFEDEEWGKAICQEVTSKYTQVEEYMITIINKDNQEDKWLYYIYHVITGVSCCDRTDDIPESHYFVDVWVYNNCPWWRKILNDSGVPFQFKKILLRHAAMDAQLPSNESLYFDEFKLTNEFKKRNNLNRIGIYYEKVLDRFRRIIHQTLYNYFEKINYTDYSVMGDSYTNYLECSTVDGSIWGVCGTQTHQDIINSTPKYQQFLEFIKTTVPTLKDVLEKYLDSKALIISDLKRWNPKIDF